MGKNTKSAGKGLNPQFSTDLYRENPFWLRHERRRAGQCESHGIDLQDGRCWECDWIDALDELRGDQE